MRQIDVIEAGYSQLQQRIGAARDFADAAAAHQAYVDALILQSFMDLPNFNKLLMLILALCTRLCKLLQVQKNPDSDFAKALIQALVECRDLGDLT